MDVDESVAGIGWVRVNLEIGRARGVRMLRQR